MKNNRAILFGLLPILFVILIYGVICYTVLTPQRALAADLTKTLVFQWEDDQSLVTNFEMYWGVTAGGPYTKLTDIAKSVAGPTFESPIEAIVTGSPGTNEVRYFVLRGCGDIPIEGGGTEYVCSADSNEVSYSFWIPVGQFEVPLNFRIKAE